MGARLKKATNGHWKCYGVNRTASSWEVECSRIQAQRSFWRNLSLREEPCERTIKSRIETPRIKASQHNHTYRREQLKEPHMDTSERDNFFFNASISIQGAIMWVTFSPCQSGELAAPAESPSADGHQPWWEVIEGSCSLERMSLKRSTPSVDFLWLKYKFNSALFFAL